MALKNKALIDKMTLSEKASLCSGLDMWHTKPINSIGLGSIMLTDGPHGLRKQNSEHLGSINSSVPSTAFPTASLSACSWDRELLKEMGNAIAEECLQEQVSVVLGPGVNIKRSPLCGRNFEYFSEDPYLSGELAANYIKGVENKGIATSIKHFCANNQESYRMLVSAEMDERTLREIYLLPFEKAIKQGVPSTVMCAYNKLNGEYCSENKFLLTDILRNEWGFDGLVMSDWGAVEDRVKGILAGLELEMPSSGGLGDNKIEHAILNGTLSEESLNIAVDRLLTLILKCKKFINKNAKYDVDAHTQFATRLAEQSAVLLKNEKSFLPLNKTDRILIVGELAKIPRYQGGGSSHITPIVLTNLIDSLLKLGIVVDYEPGYSVISGEINKKLLKRAVAKAKNYAKVIVYAGLTEEYEAEGFDRKDLRLPIAHNNLIQEISAVNSNIGVVLACGSPVEMPWISNVKSVLLMYLAGGGGGLATAKLLFGEANPCGKLAETFLFKLEDSSCHYDFKYDKHKSFYTEGIYVGYRLYETINTPILFPFGHGLSYTDFEYENLSFDAENLKVTFHVKNIGKLDGYEIAQLYINKIGGKIFAPKLQLKGFEKIFIKAGERKTVTIKLDKLSFSYYDTQLKDWNIDKARYKILVGSSSKNLPLTCEVTLSGNVTILNYPEKFWYNNPQTNRVKFEDYEVLMGNKIDKTHPQSKKGNFTLNNSLDDMVETSRLARFILAVAKFGLPKFMHTSKKDSSCLMMMEMLKTTPLKKLSATSQNTFSEEMAKGLLIMFNGKFFKGLSIIIKNGKGRKIKIEG